MISHRRSIAMRDYVIVSDATLDLPMDVINRYGIRVIPMGLDIDGVPFTHYPDERELTIENFYTELKKGSISHTTQITPAVFTDYFVRLIRDGFDILYIAFSSGLSGTYNTARLVIDELSDEYRDSKIIGIDSLCASIGEGLLVMNAAIQKQNGMNIDEPPLVYGEGFILLKARRQDFLH